MWFHLEPSGGLPIYLQIMNQVKTAAAGGLIKTGDQLPSVRELAVELTVNPNTIAKAYQELEREGIIKTLRGRGTFLAEGGGTALRDEEKYRLIGEAIDRVFVEAHHLQVEPPDVERLFRERLHTWSGSDAAVNSEGQYHQSCGETPGDCTGSSGRGGKSDE